MNAVRLEIKILDSADKNCLYEMYMRLHEEKRLAVFMYADSSLENFFRLFRNAWVYVPYVGGKAAGFTAFNDFIGRNAFFHFCMFRGFEAFTADLGKMIFRSVFRNGDLENILGITPKVFRHVFPVLHTVGMREEMFLEKACFVGGKWRDGVVSRVNRENFMKAFGEVLL